MEVNLKKRKLDGNQSHTTRFKGEHESTERELNGEPVPLALEASDPVSVSPLVRVY